MGFMDKLKKALVGEQPTIEPSGKKQEVPTVAPVAEEDVDHASYKAVTISRGPKGWGGPLTIWPSTEKHLIYSVTGGGIHPVAQKIADITGGTPFDGFKSKADFHQIAVAVIDCGGTARVGVYPMKNVLTVDVHATTPAGPLMKFIKETNFVSGVGKDEIIPFTD